MITLRGMENLAYLSSRTTEIRTVRFILVQWCHYELQYNDLIWLSSSIVSRCQPGWSPLLPCQTIDRTTRYSLPIHSLADHRAQDVNLARLSQDTSVNVVIACPNELQVSQSMEQNEQRADAQNMQRDSRDDLKSPQDLNHIRKRHMTMTLTLMTLVVSFASDVFNEAIAVTMEGIYVSTEITTLGICLLIFVRGRYILLKGFGPRS